MSSLDPRYPDDPTPNCCDDRGRGLDIHAETCELEDHSDCEYPTCNVTDDCPCPCDDCERARKARAEYDELAGQDPEYPEDTWVDD